MSRLPVRYSFLLFWLLFLPFSAGAAESLEVVVTGVRGEMLQNVQAALAVPAGLVREGRIDRGWLQRTRQQLPTRAQQALEPFGYYSAQVDSRLEGPVNGRLRLLVQIRPGEPVRVEEVRVGVEGPGEGRSALQEAVATFPLRSGDVLRHQLYEEAKQALRAQAIDLGYLDADFSTRVIRVSRQQRRADIELILATGPRYQFGEATIQGAPEYPRRFLRRFLSFAPGDVFTYGQLGQTQLNFIDSDRFQEVTILPRLEAAQDLQVPIEVQLVPSLPKRLRPGIGYGTDTGARLSLNYRDLNVFRRGHEFEAEILASELKQSLGVAYIVPSYRNLDSQTAYRLGYDREDIDVFDRQTFFAEVERSRTFGEDRRGSVYLRLLQEDFTIGEEDATSRLILPGLRFSQRRYPDLVRPESGYSFNIETRGTHQVLGSDTGLLQLIVSGNVLIPLPGRFSVFIRGQSGTTWQNDPLREIPVSLRFFAGGDRSIRGYGYQRVGVEDDNGDVVGGRNLLVGSVEVERGVSENWGAAIFYDVGDAFNSFDNIDWRHGAGVGARWYTPVGPLKFDVARQMQTADPGWRLHISIGFGW